MSTRATLQFAVEPERVLSRLPARFRSIVDRRALSTKPVDLLIFETGEGHVVTLKDLRKALEARVDAVASLLAVGYDFTEEVRALISSQGGLVFSEHNVWGWTEASWHAVRHR